MVCDGLTSYSIHSPVQGTEWIPCSGLPVHTLRFPLQIRVKEGKDVGLDIILPWSCSTALAWTGDLGSNTTTATMDNQNLRKGLGPNLLRLPTPRKQLQSNTRMVVETGACKQYAKVLSVSCCLCPKSKIVTAWPLLFCIFQWKSILIWDHLLWICKVICKQRVHFCFPLLLLEQYSITKDHLHVRPCLRAVMPPDFQQQNAKCLNKTWVMAKCSNTLSITNFLAVFRHLCTEMTSTSAFKVH